MTIIITKKKLLAKASNINTPIANFQVFGFLKDSPQLKIYLRPPFSEFFSFNIKQSSVVTYLFIYSKLKLY